jgi:hypothetical protein
MKGTRTAMICKRSNKTFLSKISMGAFFFEEKNHNSRVLVLLKLFFNASTLLKSDADKMHDYSIGHHALVQHFHIERSNWQQQAMPV